MKNITRIVSTTFAALLLAPLYTSTCLADEASVTKRISAWLGENAPDVRVSKAGFLDLYEVQIGAQLVYTNNDVSHIINGEIIDAATRINLTRKRMDVLSRVNFSDLPFEQSIKLVKGNGERVAATFEDPNCGYCRKLAKSLNEMDNYTIHTFLVPLLSPSSAEISKNIWCAKDRKEAWTNLMVHNIEPEAADCAAPVEEVGKLARKLLIRGTPTIIFPDGSRVPGFMPREDLEKALDQGTADFR